MNIDVVEQGMTQDIFEFHVVVSDGESDTEYGVTVSKKYWQSLTEGRAEPSELAEESFRFLLEQEPRESILPSFDLSVIQEYFPEYEEEIRAHYKQ